MKFSKRLKRNKKFWQQLVSQFMKSVYFRRVLIPRYRARMRLLLIYTARMYSCNYHQCLLVIMEYAIDRGYTFIVFATRKIKLRKFQSSINIPPRRAISTSSFVNSAIYHPLRQSSPTASDNETPWTTLFTGGQTVFATDTLVSGSIGCLATAR